MPSAFTFRRSKNYDYAQRHRLSLLTAAHVVIATIMLINIRLAVADEDEFQSDIRPLLKRYCHECHSGDSAEAEIDLASFENVTEVRAELKVWQRVRDILDSGQMPPKDAAQPSDIEFRSMRQWVRHLLTEEAKARAGDPGAVVLRRLSHAEYTYSIRDLTGVDSLDPTDEFPVDGAAGEGFTNAGSGKGMSPSMVTKYLDAAKEIAQHAVLLPDGVEFSRHTSSRDQTDDLLTRIRSVYETYTDDGDLEGRIPLRDYVAATLAERDALIRGDKTIDLIADERNLSAKYLRILWQALTTRSDDSQLLDRLRSKWRAAEEKDAAALTAEIASWQAALWKFNSIGHIGRGGGPPSWQEPVTPVATGQDFKIKLPASTGGTGIVVYLVTTDAGDGADDDVVIWKNPRLAGDGQPPLALRDVAGLHERMATLRQRMLNRTSDYLAAAAEANPDVRLSELADRHNVDPQLLGVWLDYLALRVAGPVTVEGHFQEQILKGGNYDFIHGWGTSATPSVMSNSSGQRVRIPGVARPHGVVAHPSPALFAAIGWQSPTNGVVRITARLSDAHPECGNGVEWFVQHRSVGKTTYLWHGDFEAGGSATMPPKSITVRKGQLVSFILGPRAQSHGCDLTAIEMTISEVAGERRVWDLGRDVADDILAANPHADRHGNEGIWHFYKGEMKTIAASGVDALGAPAGSLLDAWRAEKHANRRDELAKQIQELAVGARPAPQNSPDDVLSAHLQAFAIPLDHPSLVQNIEPDGRFGKHPLGHAIGPNDIGVQAPAVVEVRLPAEIAEGRELKVTAQLDAKYGTDGSVQLRVLMTRPTDLGLVPDSPVIVTQASRTQERMRTAFGEFRDLFPVAVCYDRIVPVDEVVTLTLFHREDDYLKQLMLSDAQSKKLDRLWDQLRYVSREPLLYAVAFEQIREFSTQDRPDLVESWKPHIQTVHENTAAFRQRLTDTEPIHLASVLRLADRAWRRPLSAGEQRRLRHLYRQLRESRTEHENAIRLLVARVLTSPAFLYKRERVSSGSEPTPVSQPELATRLSYFLWSSMPDEELRRAAQVGQLTRDDQLIRQTRRLLSDSRIRRLSVQFACQWLHVRGFDQNAEKNEKLYPEFNTCRTGMYEETVRFFEDMFRQDHSVLELIDSDHTFLNDTLARHYDVEHVTGSEWRRVDGMRARGRGGILGMATFLASQSGASRTSPILRGNWIYETLLGERLPRPPANVPPLPDSVPTGLTARQLIQRHSSDPACAKCHAHVDPYGFALEQFDAIGRRRTEVVNTTATLFDGTQVTGLDGLRHYLSGKRRDDIVRQFCRKLLGFALGREVQLSDEPLIGDMMNRLERENYRFHVAVETIVLSRQFREIRGRQPAGD